LSTDASFRFERGTDINNTLYAMKRAALLIEELAGGKASSEVVDVYPKPVKGWKVHAKYSKINTLIGQNISKEHVNNILADLDIEITSQNGDDFSVLVPTYRYDVRREADIIEEVLRIYGYNNVDFPHSIRSSLAHHPKPDPDKLQNMLSDMLSSMGFSEIMNNSLTKASYAHEFSAIEKDKTVILQNPLSQDLSAMRQTLLFGGLENIAFNQNRKIRDIRFFEFGSIYWHEGQKDRKAPLDGYHEEKRLALLICGSKNQESWDGEQKAVDFFLLKSYVQNLLRKLGASADSMERKASPTAIFAEGITYLMHNKEIVSFGAISKDLLKAFDIKQEVFYADFSWTMIMQLARDAKVVSTSVPKYPAVRRDLALLIGKDTSFEDIRELAFQKETRLLRSVSLFDVYEGDKIDKDKKSYAVSFVFRDDEKTLTDKIIDKAMKRLVASFEKQFDANIR